MEDQRKRRSAPISEGVGDGGAGVHSFSANAEVQLKLGHKQEAERLSRSSSVITFQPSRLETGRSNGHPWERVQLRTRQAKRLRRSAARPLLVPMVTIRLTAHSKLEKHR